MPWNCKKQENKDFPPKWKMELKKMKKLNEKNIFFKECSWPVDNVRTIPEWLKIVIWYKQYLFLDYDTESWGFL